MKKNEKELLNKWLDNFNKDAVIKHNEKKYRISLIELEKIYSTGNYWHHKTDPSSWLSEAVVRLVRKKYSKKLPRKKAIALCAQLLNISDKQLEGNLEWNANYMAWHDGGIAEDEHSWPEE
jgi:hypothetical protein